MAFRGGTPGSNAPTAFGSAQNKPAKGGVPDVLHYGGTPDFNERTGMQTGNAVQRPPATYGGGNMDLGGAPTAYASPFQGGGMSGGGAFNPGLPQFGGGMGQFMQNRGSQFGGQQNQFGNQQNALMQAMMRMFGR